MKNSDGELIHPTGWMVGTVKDGFAVVAMFDDVAMYKVAVFTRFEDAQVYVFLRMAHE